MLPDYYVMDYEGPDYYVNNSSGFNYEVDMLAPTPYTPEHKIMEPQKRHMAESEKILRLVGLRFPPQDQRRGDVVGISGYREEMEMVLLQFG